MKTIIRSTGMISFLLAMASVGLLLNRISYGSALNTTVDTVLSCTFLVSLIVFAVCVLIIKLTSED